MSVQPNAYRSRCSRLIADLGVPILSLRRPLQPLKLLQLVAKLMHLLMSFLLVHSLGISSLLRIVMFSDAATFA